MKNFVTITGIILLLLTSLKIYSQELSGENTENQNGFWAYTETKTQMLAPITGNVWAGSIGDLNVNARWIDALNIQHQVSCSYKWEEPQHVIKPGMDVRLVGSYINTDYSTTSRVITGITITFNKYNEPSQPKTIEFLKISKDNNNFANEMRTGYMEAPRFENDKILEMRVTCYIGKNQYVTSYYYNWTN